MCSLRGAIRILFFSVAAIAAFFIVSWFSSAPTLHKEFHRRALSIFLPCDAILVCLYYFCGIFRSVPSSSQSHRTSAAINALMPAEKTMRTRTGVPPPPTSATWNRNPTVWKRGKRPRATTTTRRPSPRVPSPQRIIRGCHRSSWIGRKVHLRDNFGCRRLT